MEWFSDLPWASIEAIQFGTPEWLYVEPGTLNITKEWVEFEDKYSEHQVRGSVSSVSVVRYRKAGS